MAGPFFLQSAWRLPKDTPRAGVTLELETDVTQRTHQVVEIAPLDPGMRYAFCAD
jgi:hypothetical protein